MEMLQQMDITDNIWWMHISEYLTMELQINETWGKLQDFNDDLVTQTGQSIHTVWKKTISASKIKYSVIS